LGKAKTATTSQGDSTAVSTGFALIGPLLNYRITGIYKLLCRRQALTTKQYASKATAEKAYRAFENFTVWNILKQASDRPRKKIRNRYGPALKGLSGDFGVFYGGIRQTA
jgi:hypothetical protein